VGKLGVPDSVFLQPGRLDDAEFELMKRHTEFGNELRTTLLYIAAQLSGAVVGSLPLLLWGAMGKSVDFEATFPGPGILLSTALLGEVITTFVMVALLAVFLGFRKIRPFTPAIFPPSLRPHGVGGGADFGHQHQPGPQPWPVGHLRAMAGGGYTGPGRWPGCCWPSSPAVSWRSASKSPSCTTLTATATVCFEGRNEY
jgi:hypothetical protein